MMIRINEDGYLETDLYKKKTAEVQYLLPSSCHPGHITRNIPYSLAYRLLRICSKRETFKLRLEELRQDLLLRSYKHKIIEDAFKRIMQIERSEAIKRVNKVKKDNTVLATTYHPFMPPISKIVRKHWNVMIKEAPSMKKCFPNPSVVAYKHHKNRRDILIRAKLPPKRDQGRIDGFKNCGELCNLCTLSPHGTSKNHTCKHTKGSFKINSPMTCKTTGVIYRITCNKCPNFVYIGETGRSMRERFIEHHKDAYKKDINKPCRLHFSLPGHSEINMRGIVQLESLILRIPSL